MEKLENHNEEKTLKVLVNGIPNLLLIPSDKMHELIAVLERKIVSFYEKNSEEVLENSGKLLTG